MNASLEVELGEVHFASHIILFPKPGSLTEHWTALGPPHNEDQFPFNSKLNTTNTHYGPLLSAAKPLEPLFECSNLTWRLDFLIVF